MASQSQSPTRADSLSFIQECFDNYLPNNANKKRCLYIGVAGNEKINGRPIPEEYELYKKAGYDVYTADFDNSWGADFRTDICDPSGEIFHNEKGMLVLDECSEFISNGPKWENGASKCYEDIPFGKWDLVVITQVLEHTKCPWLIHKWAYQNVAINGYLLIDCPWGPKSPPYHAEPPSFGDYWRISLDGLIELFNGLLIYNTYKFEIKCKFQSDALAAILLQAKKGARGRSDPSFIEI